MRLTVAKQGGDFDTVQAAIDALPEQAKETREIYIRNGEYRGRVIVNKPKVRLVGESRDGVVLVHDANAKQTNPDGAQRGTFLSFTLLTAAPDVTVENLTVRNDAGDGRLVGQAVAAYAAGDRGLWRGCRLEAHQDTLFCGPLMEKVLRDIAPYAADAEVVPSVGDCPPTRSRQAFVDCLIRGDVDFIFGPYRCWFEDCELFMNARGGWYTAANTPEAQPHGMVFHRCRLTGECAPGTAYLGRPWRKFARTAFLECHMDGSVSPLGFMDWDEDRVVTPLLCEWRTTGDGSNPLARHPRQGRLTDDEARQLTPQAVLTGWNPIDETNGHTEVCALDGVNAFIERYLRDYTPYKNYWNYEDGCVLKGCADLYRATGDGLCRDFALKYMEKFVMPDGTIPNFPLDKYNIDSINCGKTLFFALDETGDERYRKAADFHAERLVTHPRCACGNYWHKEIYPEQIWLDGLYMAQPFRVEYDMRFGGKREAADVVRQFENVKKYLYVPEKGLYVHACDVAKQQLWADPETGKSPNFWLRSMGWYLMALADCLELMDEQLYEHWRALRDLFVEAVAGIAKWRDADTGLWYQVIDRADVEDNYIETSGSAMVVYALLKGVRLGILDGETWREDAVRAFESLTALKLRPDASGDWHLNDICKVAGLGPGAQRDGSVAYYLSEPRVADDSKGVGPWMMALAEYRRAKA